MMELSANTIKELILPILLIAAAFRYFPSQKKPSGGLKNPLQMLVILMAIFFIILAIFSPAFPESLISLSYYLELALLIFLLRPLFRNPEKISLLLKLFLIYSAFNLIIGSVQLIQDLLAGESFSSAFLTISGLFDDAASFSLFCLLSLPLLILHLIFSKKTGKISSIILIAINLASILLQAFPFILGSFILSGSLSLLLILILLMNFGFTHHQYRQLISFISISVIFTGIIISLGFFTDENKHYQQRLNSITDYQYGVSIEKADVWEQSMNLFRNEIITGNGLGNWKTIFPSSGVKDIRDWQKDKSYTHPQNEFILLLSETGLAGFILFSLMIVFALINYIRRILGDYTRSIKVLSAGLISILLIITALLLLSDGFRTAELRILLAISIAGAIGAAQDPSAKSNESGKKLNWFLAGSMGVLALGILWIRYDNAMSLQNLAKYQHALSANDYPAAEKYCTLAGSGLRFNDLSGYPIAALNAQLISDKQKSEQATALFGEALQQAPFNSLLLMNVGKFELRNQHTAFGLQLLQQAHQINPKDNEIQLWLAWSLLEDNQPDEAYRVFSALPENFQHPDLESIKSKLLQVRLAKLLHFIDEPALQETIGRIVRDSTWTDVCWTHCRADKTHFDYQAVLEALYAMEVLDKTISATDAAVLRDKYQLIFQPI